MDFKLIEKLKILLCGVACVFLAYAYILKHGHPVVAGIVAAVFLISILMLLVFERDPFVDLKLPEDLNLASDILLIIWGIFCICFAGKEMNHTLLPIIVLLVGVGVGALDIVRLVGEGALKNKSFKDIFNEQLHLPLWVDAILMFWILFYGFKEGWDSLEAFDFVFIGLVTLDMIHNLIILPAQIRKKKQIVSEYLQQLENEKESLASVNIDTNGFDEETRKLVIDRIDLIDHILIGKMSDNAIFSRKVNKEIEKVVADRASFIESLALHYAVSHPQAVERLQQSGLSRYEIGLCCLYYMGYNGKEVKDISDTSMVYHVNSTIRQKLGLKTNDVNLSTFIRELFGTN